MKNIPDYKRIYTDLINERHPEKKETFRTILSQKDLSILDVIKCSTILTDGEDKNAVTFNQRHRCFDRETILEILDYQKEHGYSNAQLARHFKLSRNTIAKWKKKFI
ncbi:helix-turn-helix domain-containing protein [Chryseobacterium oranimense]|uniref:helix-turn-helix domain-containing protein n=1 Tax=Chryseobacterium oranimense TaxID=421058 RepID=UPI0021AF2D1D|nr:helix-turn-helix domain-containing protein [Chryseobacterium oranimense]UWX61823.1 helix-turn-helix domain-containing protein [Chryseobacterium oranimense]